LLPNPIKIRNSSAPNVLFERDFYEDLLQSIGQENSVALIGSAGTSKSTFLFWYIYKAIQAMDGGFPFPCLKTLNKPPELIIYQRGIENVYYHLIKEKKTYGGDVMKDKVLNCFDPTKVVYVYEPLHYLQSPHYDHELATVITGSPNPVRYNEYCKQNVVAKKYMPVYTEKELLTIATVLQQLMPQSDPLYNLYSESSVSERYRKYGGIIRRVLPSSNSNHEGEIKAAVQTIGWNSIVPVLHSDEITKVRGYVVQWDPKLVDTEPISGRRKYNFSEKVVKISSDYVADQIRLKSNESSSMDLK
jgi:hypothetical protein